MPDTNTPTAELIALQQAWNDAHQAVLAYTTSVETLREAGRDAELADAQADGRTPTTADLRPWTVEEDEALQELRNARENARLALWNHPDVVAAMADGTWKQLHKQLKVATGAEGWAKAGE